MKGLNLDLRGRLARSSSLGWAESKGRAFGGLLGTKPLKTGIYRQSRRNSTDSTIWQAVFNWNYVHARLDYMIHAYVCGHRRLAGRTLRNASDYLLT